MVQYSTEQTLVQCRGHEWGVDWWEQLLNCVKVFNGSVVGCRGLRVWFCETEGHLPLSAPQTSDEGRQKDSGGESRISVMAAVWKFTEKTSFHLFFSLFRRRKGCTIVRPEFEQLNKKPHHQNSHHKGSNLTQNCTCYRHYPAPPVDMETKSTMVSLLV